MTQRAEGPQQVLRLVNANTNKRETVRLPSGGQALVVRAAADSEIMGARIATLATVLERALRLFTPQGRVRVVDETEARQGNVPVLVWVGPDAPHTAVQAAQAIWLRVGPVNVSADDAEEIQPDAALTYALLGAHYSSPLTLDLESVDAGEAALERLEERIVSLRDKGGKLTTGQVAAYTNTFHIALADDLNTPTALAVIWQMLLLAQDSDITPAGKLAILALADRMLPLGLDLNETVPLPTPKTPPAPLVRSENRPAPQKPPQSPTQTAPAKEPPAPKGAPGPGSARVAASRDVRSMLHLPDAAAFSVVIVARNSLPALRPCLESILTHATARLKTGERGIEIVLVDLGSRDGSAAYADDLARSYNFVRVVLADRDLGAAAGYNIGFKQSRGRTLVLLDPAYRVAGNIWTALDAALDGADVGAAGAAGIRFVRRDSTANVLETTDVSDGEADALTGDLFALRRARIEALGFMDEKFRAARYLATDYSQNIREAGLRLVVLPALRDGLARQAGVALGGRAGLSVGSNGDSLADVEAETQAEREHRNLRLFLSRV